MPKPEMLGDAPVEAQFREQMRAIANVLDDYLNPTGEKKNGFVLMVFEFGSEGRCNYMSNAQRADVVVLLKEQLRRFEGAPDVTGRA